MLSQQRLLVAVCALAFAALTLACSGSLPRDNDKDKDKPSGPEDNIIRAPEGWKEKPLGLILGRDVQADSRFIVGTVENKGPKLSRAMITFNLYDRAGSRVGTAMDTINNLEEDGRWKFKAAVFGVEYTTWKLDELKGY